MSRVSWRPLRWNTRSWRALCVLIALALAGGCGRFWSTNAPYDPLRCDPACVSGEVCFEGRCQSLDSGPPDIQADLVKMADAATDASLCVGSSSPTCPWVAMAGSSTDDEGRGLAIDEQGGLAMVGDYSGSALYGTTSLTARGMRDIVLSKLSSAGAFLWSVSAGSIGTDQGSSVAVDGKGNTFICGRLDLPSDGNAIFGSLTYTSSVGGSHGFVAKVDSTGSFVWVAMIGTGSNALLKGGASCNDLVVDSQGQVFITGHFGSSVAFGPGSTWVFTAPGTHADAFVAKLDTSGHFKWVTQAGGPTFDSGDEIILFPSGDIGVVGSFSDTATFGAQKPISKGETDMFASKLDPSGIFIWTATGGGINKDYGMGVALDSLGNLLIAGAFTSSISFGSHTLSNTTIVGSAVAKADTNGTWLWAQQVSGASAFVKPNAMATDSKGNIFLTGYFNGTMVLGTTTLKSAGDGDIHVSILDSTGQSVRGLSAGGLLWDSGSAIVVDSSGVPYVTGPVQNPTTFNGVSKSFSKGYDAFIWKCGLR